MRRSYFLLLLLILPSVNYAVTGFPGINMSLSVYHGTTNTNDKETETSTTNKSSNIIFGLGTTHSAGMYLGTIYDLTMKNDGNGNLQDTNLGVSVGFTDRGAYMIYHHFLSSTYNLDSNTKYEGNGGGFDLGYQTNLGAGFSIGGQFSYKKIKLKDKTVNGEKTSSNYSRETIYPSLIFGFSF